MLQVARFTCLRFDVKEQETKVLSYQNLWPLNVERWAGVLQVSRKL